MRIEDLEELHYITPIANVASIMQKGILCHKLAEKVRHNSVAMPEIQERRAKKRVPGGRPLHDYVNLYVCARNPMLFKRKDQHADLCILRISTNVLDLPGTVVSDRNASSDWAYFSPAPGGVKSINRDLVLAEYWTHPDKIERMRRVSIKCAEILVPDCIEPCYIVGAYVSSQIAKRKFEATRAKMPVTIDSHLFFG